MGLDTVTVLHSVDPSAPRLAKVHSILPDGSWDTKLPAYPTLYGYDDVAISSIGELSALLNALTATIPLHHSRAGGHSVERKFGVSSAHKG